MADYNWDSSQHNYQGDYNPNYNYDPYGDDGYNGYDQDPNGIDPSQYIDYGDGGMNGYDEAYQDYDLANNGYMYQNYDETYKEEEAYYEGEDIGNDGLFSKPSESLYPAWCPENDIPISQEEILKIFLELGDFFGFQKDSVTNMYDHFMCQLDSRASRMSGQEALTSLHTDYIGGEHANYRKWYFAAHLDLDEMVGSSNTKLKKKNFGKKLTDNLVEQKNETQLFTLQELEKQNTLQAEEYKWKQKMSEYTVEDYVYQVGLYLLLWGEANQIRFLPECLCFLFKCAFDYFSYYKALSKEQKGASKFGFEEYDYLNRVITPIYNYIRNQQYHLIDGKWIRTEKDHTDIIGYDDINSLFWYPEGIFRIKLRNGSRLVDIVPELRYKDLGEINWEKTFYKTYKEKRTWSHVTTNFNRIWIIHLTMFWYYTCFNSPTLYTKNYVQLVDNQPLPQVVFSAVAFGGTISCLTQIFATLTEWSFVPREWPGAQHLTKRLFLLFLLTSINFGPSVYVFGFFPLDVYSKSALVTSIIQFVISIFTFIYLAVVPSGKLFQIPFKRSQKYVSSQTFTASFPNLSARGKILSYTLWVCVFAAKFSESYFFLTLSLRDPIRNLSIMEMTRCNGDQILGSLICKHQARITLVLMLITDLVLFFLDTYLWYIICNCLFSVGLSFVLGISILSPWRNIFTRLPKRIYSKILFTSESHTRYKPKLLISQVWNAIIISMYREHLLSVDQVCKLLYEQKESGEIGSTVIRSPLFFVFQDDSSMTLADFFLPESEAERRISFFAQSLATPLPEPTATEAMPTFTVLIPHYSEKILLTLKEVIKEDKDSKLSLLEYLKQLHPVEWECFVKDTKVLACASNQSELSKIPSEKEHKSDLIKNKIDDLPFYCIGFKSSAPEYALRTRIWASLRTQTLYRTVSGFMNYQRAIKLLHRVENPELIQRYGTTPGEVDEELRSLAQRKFHLLISMQRFQKFSEEELEDFSHMIKAYGDIKVCFLEEEEGANGAETVYYSTLINVKEKDDKGNFKKISRIRLSGNPIIGDGKSDNQNNALIYYRGEYIQVIDANQDNYLEECLKIRSVLSEFEEYEHDPNPPYIPGILYKRVDPVAIVGAREYIFSENTGVLGDVAAGKEQTFGTLFARTLAEIGGKLHYGHPDFLNAIFMTTRGGISKAQKGLHLNEDIYAGMTALLRGGRIKHCDYYQCGKGRDLGFGSILNFTTKIGAGMGEQMLSREYYFLGTQLPLDRFLSFYYAHPGFHINNLFIILSVHLFMLVLVNLGSLKHESILCHYDKNVPYTDLQIPIGCYNLQPVLNWVTRFVLSVFICFFISFVPLVVHELSERGLWKALTRITCHFLSMAPFFEIFVCQIYSNALKSDITFGGARYISTGRGFATSRIPFSVLYSRYSTSSMYSGSRLVLMIIFASISMWQPALLWFWITLVSMCLAPFIFNPHQFAWSDFFLDYRDYIRWLCRGNSRWHQNSWIGFIRNKRSRFTGYKRKILGDDKNNSQKVSASRAPFFNAFADEVILPFMTATTVFCAFMFINSQNGVKQPEAVNPIARILVATFLPVILNTLVLIILFPISLVAGPILSCCCSQVSTVIAFIAHGFSVIINVINFELIFVLEGWNFTRATLCFICVSCLQRVILKFSTVVFLTRELKSDASNRAWWSGKWITELGWLSFTQPVREFLVKIAEQQSFAADFLLGHFLLFSLSPFLLVPYMDRWHSKMLFWSKSSKQFRAPILSKKRNAKRKRLILKYIVLYLLIMVLLAGALSVPIIADKLFSDIRSSLPSSLTPLIQPNRQNNNDTGPINAPLTILRNTPSMTTWRTVA